jgi:hypothetical protein
LVAEGPVVAVPNPYPPRNAPDFEIGTGFSAILKELA